MTDTDGVTDIGALQRTTREIADQYRRSRVVPGDIVMSIGPSFGKVMLVPPELDGANLTQGTARLAPGPQIDARWLYWFLQSKPAREFWESSVGGATFRALNLGPLGSTPTPEVPVEEQRRIADFLDDQVARIDALVRDRWNQTVLLEEAHRNAMDALVTGQEMEPSHTARWLPYGKVPDSWQEGQLRKVRCTVETGPFGSQLHADEYVDNGWPVINPASIQDGHLVALEGMSISDRTRERLARHMLHPGDVVFGRRGELGRAAVVRGDNAGWICGTGSLVVRLQSDELSPDYLYRLLSTKALKHFFDVQSVGSTMANLNTGILLSMPLLVPTRHEQDEIVRECSRTEEAYHRAVEALESSSRLLEERKRSLITAAVTGELDVTTVRPIGMGKWVPNIGVGIDAPAAAQASSIGGIG